MKKVSVEEFIQWFDEHEPWPKPDEQMLREMAEEGITFEIHETTFEDTGNTYEYPQINSVNWGKNVSSE
jgi:hypothetical protein